MTRVSRGRIGVCCQCGRTMRVKAGQCSTCYNRRYATRSPYVAAGISPPLTGQHERLGVSFDGGYDPDGPQERWEELENLEFALLWQQTWRRLSSLPVI